MRRQVRPLSVAFATASLLRVVVACHKQESNKVTEASGTRASRRRAPMPRGISSWGLALRTISLVATRTTFTPFSSACPGREGGDVVTALEDPVKLERAQTYRDLPS